MGLALLIDKSWQIDCIAGPIRLVLWFVMLVVMLHGLYSGVVGIS